MGMMDYIRDVCPWCGNKTETQTKLGENLCLDITPGSGHPINLDSTEPTTFVLECKNPCEKCNHVVNAKIVDNKFVGFTKEEAQYVEECWGNYYKC